MIGPMIVARPSKVWQLLSRAKNVRPEIHGTRRSREIIIFLFGLPRKQIDEKQSEESGRSISLANIPFLVKTTS